MSLGIYFCLLYRVFGVLFCFFSVIKLTYSQVCEKHRRVCHYSWPFWFWPLETQLELDMQNYIVHIIRDQSCLLSQLDSLWLRIMPWGQGFSLPASQFCLATHQPDLQEAFSAWWPMTAPGFHPTSRVTQMKWHLFLPSCSDQSLQIEFH